MSRLIKIEYLTDQRKKVTDLATTLASKREFGARGGHSQLVRRRGIRNGNAAVVHVEIRGRLEQGCLCSSRRACAGGVMTAECPHRRADLHYGATTPSEPSRPPDLHTAESPMTCPGHNGATCAGPQCSR